MRQKSDEPTKKASHQDKPYPVFLSFNSDDREAVEKIALYLADTAKLSPWFDQWELIPGEPQVTEKAEPEQPKSKPEQIQTTPPPEKMPSIPVVHLRSKPLSVSDEEYRKVFKLDKGKQYIENDFEYQGDVVVDHATGLMWQKSGSDTHMDYWHVRKYVKTLNEQKFVGYNDWRLPTIPELMSLLEPRKQANNLYINPIFDSTQRYCRSADSRPSWVVGLAWYVDFDHGIVDWTDAPYVRCVRSLTR